MEKFSRQRLGQKSKVNGRSDGWTGTTGSWTGGGENRPPSSKTPTNMSRPKIAGACSPECELDPDRPVMSHKSCHHLSISLNRKQQYAENHEEEAQHVGSGRME